MNARKTASNYLKMADVLEYSGNLIRRNSTVASYVLNNSIYTYSRTEITDDFHVLFKNVIHCLDHLE